MGYQKIRYFLRAAEAGSFSKAAAQMFVSSQALTRQIGKMEQEIGGKLFERHSGGVRLTELGEEAYHRYLRVDQDLTRIEEDLKLMAAGPKRQMNIGIFSALPQEKIVTPLITFLLGNNPDWQINLNLLELNEGMRMLRQGRLDLLLTNMHQEDDWQEYRCLSFEKHPVKVIVSLYHPWIMKGQITVEDMRQETFLKMDMDGDHYRIPVSESFYGTIPCKNIQKCSNFQTLFALLQQGESFAVFPKAFAYMESARLKYFDYPGRTFCFYTALLYNPHLSHGLLDDVVNTIQEEFNLTELDYETLRKKAET